MKKYIKLITIIVGIILLIGLVLSLELNTLKYTSTEHNLTFSGNENITRNISINRYVNVTSAYMNLSGYYLDNFNLNSTINFYANNASSGITFNGTDYFSSDYGNDRVIQHNKDWSINSSFQTRYRTLGCSGADYQIYGITYLNGLFYTIEHMSNVCNSYYGSYIGKYYNNGSFISYNLIGGINIFNYADITNDGTNLIISLPSSTSYRVYNTSIYSIENVTISEDLEYGFSYCNNYYIGANSTYMFRYNSTFDKISNANISSIISLGGSLYCNSTDILLLRDINVGVDQLKTYKNILEINNPYTIINNTNMWNYTGVFNKSDNKTNDFSSVLNSALNNGKCDCTNCSISGSNCTIPITFHSDSNGVLEVSDINITYNPIPNIYLKSPSNASYSSQYNNFTCNTTDEIELTNVTLEIWNSTGPFYSESKNISGKDNSSTFENINLSVSDTYLWNCLVYNNGSYSNYNENNNTLIVDIDNPIINLNYPTNLLYIKNGTNLQINYTPDHATQTVDTCVLYTNRTGSWLINQTDTSITELTINTFNLNLTDGYYNYGIWCNTTETGNNGVSYNYTFTIDTILPIMNAMTIKTTANSNQINFTSNITDINLNTCWYSIWDGSTPGTNTTFICNNWTLATAPGFGTYYLHLYANDSAGNENTQNASFITSISSGITSTGGGGTIIEKLEEEPDISFCLGTESKFKEVWKTFVNDMSWTNFKLMWFALWNNSFCVNSASLVPLGVE